jgi:hypothetical protein
MTDLLSPLSRDILGASPNAYARLTVTGPTPANAKKLLDGVTPDQLLTVPVVNPAAAYAMLAGLWLWHDALHECHEIAQKSPDDLQGHKARNREHLDEMARSLAFWHALLQ